MWLESHAELRDHPKVDLLMDLLQTTRRDVVGLLHFVWWRSLTYAPSGDLSDFTDGQIARWADWDGDPGHLVSALKTAGFLDSARTLHDWDEYAGRYIDRRSAEAARKRGARKAAAGRANGASPEASTGHPPDVRPDVLPRARAEYLTGPDLNRTGPDITTHPLPPPAEGEQQQATAEDCQLWKRALAALPSMTPGNREQVHQLEPLGRAPDGGLRLRAPPGHRLARFRPQIARALADAGDENGTHVQIIER
jgi:hypothetical protein